MTSLKLSPPPPSEDATLRVRSLPQCESKHTVFELLNPRQEPGLVTVFELDEQGHVQSRHSEDIEMMSRWAYSMPNAHFLVQVKLDSGVESFVNLQPSERRRMVIRSTRY